MAQKERNDVVITGVQNEEYPKYRSHDNGYAVDVRTSNLGCPSEFAEKLRVALDLFHPKDLKVLYGDEDHMDHIHAGLVL